MGSFKTSQVQHTTISLAMMKSSIIFIAFSMGTMTTTAKTVEVSNRQQWGTLPPLNFLEQGQWCDAQRPDDARLPCILAGMFYADCCQTMMNWFPAVGVTCSPSDGPMGNMCAIMYTTGNTLMPMVLAQANEMAQANGNESER